MTTRIQDGRTSKALRLRRLVESRDLSFIMEAHNGLSTRLVERAGFEGVWASGLSIATALGIRDSNEASWTQVLDVIEFMADATDLPILVDGDNGFGNFNNARRLVRKLCERSVAGVAIEDKQFPKLNSFVGENQMLADVDEFCGKIKAARDAQTEPDFCLVARCEAFIAGRSPEEVLERASRYAEAGADAVFVHSKAGDAREIESFMERWSGAAPIVIAPTTYAATPTEEFRRLGISLVIWANHSIRASAFAVDRVLRRIRERESVHGLDDEISSLGDIFDLLDYDELAAAELRYLPGPVKHVAGSS